MLNLRPPNNCSEHVELGICDATLLSNRLKTPLEFESVHTLVGGFAVRGSLGDGPLTASTAHTNTVDYNTLFSTVSQTSGFIGSCRSGSSVNGGELTVLPATNSQEESHSIRLLFTEHFRDVF